MPKTVQDRFLKDPEWHLIEELVMSYITPLLDMSTIDTTLPAEDVKAQIIGRRLAYEQMWEFVQQSKLISEPQKIKTNPFI
jgi:hypothetical protein